jgi:hypothetical protein
VFNSGKTTFTTVVNGFSLVAVNHVGTDKLLLTQETNTYELKTTSDGSTIFVLNNEVLKTWPSTVAAMYSNEVPSQHHYAYVLLFAAEGLKLSEASINDPSANFDPNFKVVTVNCNYTTKACQAEVRELNRCRGKVNIANDNAKGSYDDTACPR